MSTAATPDRAEPEQATGQTMQPSATGPRAMTSPSGLAPATHDLERPWTNERHARMVWARISEPEDALAAELTADHGICDALEQVMRHTGIGRAEAAQRFARRAVDVDLAADLHATRVCRSRVIVPGDEQWPAHLADLPAPPWCLWVSGPLDPAGAVGEAGAAAVAVVGARAATAYGHHLAAEVAAELAARGFCVVSGAALGIDGAAHRGALAVEGATLAVLACGIDRAYPAAHRGIIEQIRATGAVITEMPPGSAPTKSRFLHRNRIIAALAGGTVVVEASLRSGALRTARIAADLLRPVAAMPGPVTSAVSSGCHEAIRQGYASIVTDADEIAELVSPMGSNLAPVKRGASRAGDQFDSLTRRVFEALPLHRSRTVDDLCRIAGLSPREVIAALGELDVAGVVENRLDGWGRRR